jgi:hypothetical protein
MATGGQFYWPPAGSSTGRQRAIPWPPTGSFSWPLTPCGGQAEARAATVRATRHKVCTHSEAHKPLSRENTCPRWDSNCIPALANVGKPRKRAESGPVQQRYETIQNEECGQCPHALLPIFGFCLGLVRHLRNSAASLALTAQERGNLHFPGSLPAAGLPRPRFRGIRITR